MASNYNEITKHNIEQLGKDTASRKTQINMYSDSTHFIYELLQNADDHEATEISFKLFKDKLIIEHNGKLFNEDNVKSITYIGKSTSRDDLLKEGRFGVGFKSVFAFTASPIIVSGNEHFEIYKLYRVREYPYPKDLSNSRTRFILPFNHDVEEPDYVETLISAESAFDKIAKRLMCLNMSTLLFTKNIREIRWEADDRSGHYLREDKTGNSHRSTVITDGDRIRKYMVFSRTPKWKNKEHKGVEIAFALNDNDQIEQIEEFLCVLFPTAQETHLKFILNGPYRTNPSRETISIDDNFNLFLINETCILLKDALLKLKEMGFLTIQFLSVLPNHNDTLNDFYSSILDSSIKTFQENELVPTDDNQHAFSQNVLKGPSKLRDVIRRKELSFLFERNDICWAMGIKQYSRPDTFLNSLDIDEWDTGDFLNLLIQELSEKSYSRAKEPNAEFADWLSEKPIDWHQQLYALLYNHYELIKHNKKPETLRSLKLLKIIRLSDGNYSTGSDCYFPSDDNDYDEILPLVDSNVYSLGRKEIQKETALKFLKKIGITEVTEFEEIKGILKNRYSSESEEPNDKTYYRDLKRFIEFVKQSPDNSNIFAKYLIFKDNHGARCRPCQILIDSPFLLTGISVFHKTLNKDSIPTALSKEYQDEFKKGLNQDEFVRFAKAVGCTFELKVSETTCQNNPEWEKLYDPEGGRGKTENRDYIISDLKKALNKPSKELSKLLWNTMNSLDDCYLKATYRKKAKSDPRYGKSQLVHVLISTEWVPQKSQEEGFIFVKPCDASRDKLPEDFIYDVSKKWLDKVGFGKSVKKKSKELTISDKDAKKIGFESADVIKQCVKLVKRARERGISLDSILADGIPSEKRTDDQIASGAPRGTVKSNKSSSSRRKEIRRTYVKETRKIEGNEVDSTRKDQIDKVGAAGVKHVLDYEVSHGRYPEEQEHFNPGYDIESKDEEGNILRYIEVKSVSGDWDPMGVGMTKPQFEKANKLGDKFWLYVVEKADSNDFKVYKIKNPAQRVTQFLYDDGWKNVAERDSSL